jgi:uncharacterized membrane protein
MKRLVRCAAAVLLTAALCIPAFADASDAAGGGGAEHLSLGHRIAQSLRVGGLPDWLTVVLISTLPIVELRGAVPVGILFGMNPWVVFALSVFGNMIPIPFILLLLGPLSKWCMRFRAGKAFFDWLFTRTRKKTAEIEKYETLGLTIFVAIPLPATGAWTGAMAAFLLAMRFNHSMWSIFLGVVIAGVIMTVLSLLGWIGAIVAGVALGALVIGCMSRWLKKEERG